MDSPAALGETPLLERPRAQDIGRIDYGSRLLHWAKVTTHASKTNVKGIIQNSRPGAVKPLTLLTLLCRFPQRDRPRDRRVQRADTTDRRDENHCIGTLAHEG